MSGENRAGGSSSAAATMARQRWELENGILEEKNSGGGAAAQSGAAVNGSGGSDEGGGDAGSSAQDALFAYDCEEQIAIQREHLWSNNPEYFSHVKVRNLIVLNLKKMMCLYIEDNAHD